MDLAARLEVVTNENTILRERIEQLEEQLGGRFLAPVEWCLTGSESRVFGALYSRETATKDNIMAVLYRDHGEDEAEIKIVDVFVCKLRKKIKPFGIEIRTIWGMGWAIDAANKARAREQIEARRAAA